MSPLHERWSLDPEVTFLNHGSFGACPRAVLAVQAEWRARLERQPVRFYLRELFDAQNEAREAVADFVGADPAGFAFVRNATAGVNAVLRSLKFSPGDELLITNHQYPACRNAAQFVAERAGADVVAVHLPFEGSSPDEVITRVMEAVSDRTRLAVIDHVTSQTGLVLPVETLVPLLQERGVDVLVDGAHAPGMLPLDLEALGAAYYTANLHKWVCAPKGAGFLVARHDRQEGLHPVSISHGYGLPALGRSRFHLEFDWCGTDDPTPFLSAPAAIAEMGQMLPGGWPALRAHNRELALQARRVLADALGVEPPCTESMIGALVALPLPPGAPGDSDTPLYRDPWQTPLLEDYGIEVPITPFPAPPQRLIRVSAQVYNSREDYVRLAAALTELIGA